MIDPPLADAIWHIFFAKTWLLATVGGTLFVAHHRATWLSRKRNSSDYDWGALCLPTVPWSKTTRKMPFFARNDDTPLLVAAVMGLQHCFAMIGGEE